MAEEKESRFPMTFDKCRDCGCMETTTQIAWREQVEAGRISEESADLLVCCEQTGVPLMDPKRGPSLTVPILFDAFDICAGCGKKYCVRASITNAPVGVKPGGPGMQQFPPGFPGMNNPRTS